MCVCVCVCIYIYIRMYISKALMGSPDHFVTCIYMYMQPTVFNI